MGPTHAIVPFDPLIGYQWHYDYKDDSDGNGRFEGANLYPAWGITEGNSNTIVAVVDTGLSLNHPDLIGRELAGYDFISSPGAANDGDGRDPNATDPGDWVVEGECGNDKDGNPKPGKSSSWHGTHVAGTVGARANNDIGVAGVNWNARILPVRALGKCGGSREDIAAATQWAAGIPVPNTAGWVPGMPVTYMTNPNPAQVINLSLGGLSDVCPTVYQNAFTSIRSLTNATVVVAAGNDFINAALATPANCANVITVAAGTVVGSLAYYSNWGPNVDITAPGGDGEYKVLSTYNDGQTIAGNPSYAWLQGTSMAAPHVSGVASLLYGLNPFITADQVLKTLQFSSRPFPQDKGGINCNTTYCGAGLLDAFVSVLLVPGTPTPTATATVTNTPIPNATSTPTNTPIPTNTATPTLTPSPTPGIGQISIILGANPEDGTNFVFQTSAVGELNFSFAWGSEGTGNGQFNSPTGVAVDKAGFIYVADRDNHRVQKFNPGGSLLKEWGGQGTGNGQFNEAYSVAVDSIGNVYVSDSNNHRIQKFDSDGNFIKKWGSQGTGNGQFNLPHGLAVDKNDNIYVADLGNNRFQKFDSDGNYLGKWGSAGSGNGQFTYATAVTVDKDGFIYVADGDNHRIQKFDEGFNFVTKWGEQGTGLGQFEGPAGITVDALGDIYVMDQFNHRIQKFDANGNWQTLWGERGPGDDQFDLPNGLASDPTGAVYVADLGNDRIKKYRSDTFSLDRANPEDFDQAGGSRYFGELVPGAYTFTQADPPAGWSLTGITCDSGDWEATLFNSTVLVYLGPTGNVNCTFMNQKDSLGQPTPTVTGTPPTATPTMTPTPFPTAETFVTPTPTSTSTPDPTKYDTETRLWSIEPDNSSAGEPITVTARVYGYNGNPTGTVTMSDGSVSCSGTLSTDANDVTETSCVLTPATPGDKLFTATYGGDSTYNGSSDSLYRTIGDGSKADTTTHISDSFPNPSQAGEPVFVEVFVNKIGSTPDYPTGEVTITDGTVSCSGTLALNDFASNVAGCRLTFITAGVKTLTATYPGDIYHNGSSGTATHTVIGTINFTDFANLPIILRQ